MNQSTIARAPPHANETERSAAGGPIAVSLAVVETFTPEDRHAAVCTGAVEYLPDLRAYARALTGNGHQAEDLVQNAIMRALSASHQFTPGTNFSAWIFTILRNGFYNQWRSPLSRQVQLDDCVAITPTTAPTQEGSLEVCDFRRAFAQLVPDQREALLLVGASGLPYAEAAEICKCASGTIKSRVSRARANLRALMDQGSLKLLRRDVTPISAVDLAFALETSIAARNLPNGRSVQAKLTPRESAGREAGAGYRPGDLETPAMLRAS